MPKDLSKAAAKEWRSILPQLRLLGVLSQIDSKALAAYCHSFARWMEAEREVERLGIVVEEPILMLGEPTGYVRYKKNPAVTISESAMKLMKSFLIEFGMTPSSRSRVRIEKPPTEEDPMDAFLKGAQPMDSKRVN